MKEFARSVIQDLIAIQMKAAAMKFLGGAFDMFKGGLGGGGGTSMSQFEYAMVSGFADGGDPPVNQVSVVGERGPELFIPKTAGTIIPNNALGNLGGNSGPVFNGPYIANMSAIDTQSAMQFLARNKQAVWSANQSAQRSMPVSR
jgi:phage-related minor tail protein